MLGSYLTQNRGFLNLACYLFDYITFASLHNSENIGLIYDITYHVNSHKKLITYNHGIIYFVTMQ